MPLNRETRRKLKKQEREIEDFIKWLKMFYKSSEKEKNAILLDLARRNEAMYKFVHDLKDIGEYDQERLYNQLRGNFV